MARRLDKLARHCGGSVWPRIPVPAQFELKCGVGSDSHTRGERSGCIVSEQISARRPPVAAPPCDLPADTLTAALIIKVQSSKFTLTLAVPWCARSHSDSIATHPTAAPANQRSAAAATRIGRIRPALLGDSPPQTAPRLHRSTLRHTSRPRLLCSAAVAPSLRARISAPAPAPIAHRQHSGGVLRGETVAARNRATGTWIRRNLNSA